MILLSACLKCTAEREWKKCEGKWATMIQGETCRQYAMYKWKIRDGRGVGGYSVGMHVELLQLFVPLAEKITVTQFGGPMVDNCAYQVSYIEIHWVQHIPCEFGTISYWISFVLLQYIDILLYQMSATELNKSKLNMSNILSRGTQYQPTQWSLCYIIHIYLYFPSPFLISSHYPYIPLNDYPESQKWPFFYPLIRQL